MNEKKKSKHPDSATEDEIRRDRKFNLSEALGRGNADLLKGASPVAPGRRVLLEIEHFLEARLDDPDGSLLRTLMARLTDNPPLLARHFETPLGALAEFLNQVLADDPALATLVRDTDARWGREYHERPHFEVDGRPASKNDPYTLTGVRARLNDLNSALSAPGGSENRNN